MTIEKAVFNRYLFSQISLDSGALTILGTVLHNFSESGRYVINVWRGESLVGSKDLSVDPACTDMQVNFDLAHFDEEDKECCGDAATPLSVHPKGYAIFHVSSGAGGFAVTAGRVDTERPDKVFDSRELQAGDMFAATILRPGIYSVANALARTKAKIAVAYPKVGQAPYVPDKPVFIECTREGFQPPSIEVGAGQSQVFRIVVPTRLKIDLLKPDDGPGAGQPLQRPGWRKTHLDVQETATGAKRADGTPAQGKAAKKTGDKTT